MVKCTSPLAQRFTISMMLVLMITSSAATQTRVKPGFNLFSVQQDVEFGREASKEIEKQVPVLDDATATRYISELGMNLARKSTMPDLPWQFKLVNSSDINAFALPGGFIYVNRGLIEAAETEGQLVGVLGHELAHVTLRHGTNQLSKAVLAQGGLAILGGSLGGGWGAVATRLGAEFVVGTLFLKFGRTAETQADIIGTQLMAEAGYDPRQMAKMFELLGSLRDKEPGRLEEFFSSHPNPSNRVKRVNDEIKKLKPVVNPIVTTNQFMEIRARLKAMPPAPRVMPGRTGGSGTPAPPSRELSGYRHPHGWYEIVYPSNWRVTEAKDKQSVLFAPQGGVQQDGAIVYGAVVDLFEPQGVPRSLEEATEQLIAHLRRTDSYLQVVSGSQRRQRINGVDTLLVVLEGRPPQQNYQERVTLAVRWLGREIIFLACVSPVNDYATYQPAFEQMINRWRLNN